MLTYSPTLFSSSLFLVHFTYFCALIVSCMFMMLCVFFYYLNSSVSDNKHELIQVAVTANITIHKIRKSFCILFNFFPARQSGHSFITILQQLLHHGYFISYKLGIVEIVWASIQAELFCSILLYIGIVFKYIRLRFLLFAI